jgi:yeast amino acid transporter
VWNTQDFLTAYINIPIFFTLWIGWTLYMRTPFWRAHEMDFVTVRCVGARFLYDADHNSLTWLRAISIIIIFFQGIPSFEETESPEEPPRNLGEKIFNILF